MQEFQFIEKYLKPLTKGCKASQNLEDDVARISLKKDEELVISKDLFAQDVHFLKEDGAYKIAKKLLLTNISDIAASGAKPLYYMLGFSKNENLDESFYREFARGLKETQDKFNICLIGGDSINSKNLVFSVTIFGLIKKNKILLRKNAKKNDLIFVTGTIGDAYLGRTNPDKYSQNRHFFPQPKTEFTQLLVKNNLAKCAIDISDGLLADLKHICQTSKLNAEIFLDKIPLSISAKKFLKNNKQINILDLLCGGDDYEIIFAANKKDRNKIEKLAKNIGCDISHIGSFKETSKDGKLDLLDQNLEKINITKFGYEH